MLPTGPRRAGRPRDGWIVLRFLRRAAAGFDRELVFGHARCKKLRPPLSVATASQLVWGRTYQGDQPCFKLTKVVFHHGNGLDGDDKVVVEDGEPCRNGALRRAGRARAGDPNANA
ncbi:MAG TPA: hypothetical protein VNZ03_35705 [Terriglobales bacterium]|nr:hypothetical protein [Terriglobales bacterium]